MDMESLGLADRTFDAAVCGHGLQFTSNLRQALREAQRVLRPSAAFAASVPARPHVNSVWEIIDRTVDRFLPPGPEATDDQATRATVSDPEAFRSAALDAGFSHARVEAVEEEVVWGTAEELVSKFTSWWECAARIEALEPAARERFMSEAIAEVKRDNPGPITTHGRNLVLLASKA
jgi:SAM-dependent methyltransferase